MREVKIWEITKSNSVFKTYTVEKFNYNVKQVILFFLLNFRTKLMHISFDNAILES